MTHTLQQIPIAKPILDEREVEAVRRVILSGWVTQGPEVAAFEREFADYVGARHGVAVTSGTTALHLAIAALDLPPGDSRRFVGLGMRTQPNARGRRERLHTIDVSPRALVID